MNIETLHECGIEQIEVEVRSRLNGRLRNFRLVQREQGLVLRGQAQSYYTKQLAQQAVLDATDQRIIANEIEVK